MCLECAGAGYLLTGENFIIESAGSERLLCFLIYYDVCVRNGWCFDRLGRFTTGHAYGI